MSILEIIVIVVVLIVVVILILALQKPNEFRVSRSSIISAPPDVVFEYVNDLEKGQEWSPWVEMDPDAEYTFEGPKAGEGATLHWEGKKTGKGTMTILESRQNELVRSRLEFFKPMQGVNTVDYLLESQDQQTKITWTIYGPNKFMGKLMSIFMDCEKMTGDQFEKGLSNLKKLLEKK